MKPIIWQNRLVKMLDEATWAMSRVGDHENFDYMSDQEPKRDCAIAGCMGGLPKDGKWPPNSKIRDIFKLDEEKLLFVSKNGALWLMTGDPADKGRIELLLPQAMAVLFAQVVYLR